jgi:hypothetical protein
MLKFIEDWQTRRRIKAFLKINPGYLLSDEQYARRAFLRDNPGYLGVPPLKPEVESLDDVKGLNPLVAHGYETYHEEIQSGDEWDWQNAKRRESSIVTTEITT